MNSYIPLVRGFSEVIDDGWLMGEFRDFVLLADSTLVPVWREIAPNQPIQALDRAEVVEKCIIFDAGEEPDRLCERLQRERPSGSALSFLTEYYPSVCAKTFMPGRMTDKPGPGVIMFQTPRTGSHLMQGMIANIGDFGAPEEWIRPPVLEAVRLGVLGLVDHLVRCARHQRAFHQYWSASIVLPFLAEMWQSLSTQERQRFGEFVHRGHPFLLTRRDRIAQTWSQIRANHSGRFHVFSPHDVNKGIDEALLPPEKFWLWLIINRQSFEVFEQLARTIARNAGTALAEIYYEELLERPISEGVHRRVLGPMYEPGSHILDASSTTYFKQSSGEDAEVVAGLTRLVAEIDDVDFRRWLHLDKVAVRIFNGTVFFGHDRFDVSRGRLTCQVLLERDALHRTVVLQLEIAASRELPVQLSIIEGDSELYAIAITRNGAYMLLAEDAAVIQERSRYVIEIGETPAGSPTPHANVRLVALYAVPVEFSVVPEFPWMSSEDRTESFALYRLG